MENTESTEFLSNEDLAAFCLEVSMLLKAGIPLSYGLSIMKDNFHDKKAVDILEYLYEHTDAGEPFSMALRCIGSFPDYMVDMVEVGEKTGHMEDVMAQLHAFFQREDNLRKNIRSAVLYPAVMVVLMVVVIAVLVVKVLPVFQGVFEQLGVSMSASAVYLMQVGNVLAKSAFVLLVFLFLVALLLLLFRRKPMVKRAMEKAVFALFGKSKIYSDMATSRFADVLSLSFASGLDSGEALDMARRIAQEEGMRIKIDDCKKKTEEGESFADAVIKSGILSGVYGQMLKVGMKTGSHDSVVKEIARIYDEKAMERMEGLVSAIEPTLVIVLSVVVGIIVLCVMLPLLGIMSSIG